MGRWHRVQISRRFLFPSGGGGGGGIVVGAAKDEGPSFVGDAVAASVDDVGFWSILVLVEFSVMDVCWGALDNEVDGLSVANNVNWRGEDRS